MTIKEFDSRGRKLDKMWNQLWYEIVIKPMKDKSSCNKEEDWLF